MSGEDKGTPEERAAVESVLSRLEGEADQWSAEINLPQMCKNILHVARLNRSCPTSIREKFIGRAEDQMHAIVCQAFIEGALRMYDSVPQNLKPSPPQTRRS